MKKSYAYGGGGLAAIVIAAILLSTSTVDPLNEQTRKSIPPIQQGGNGTGTPFTGNGTGTPFTGNGTGPTEYEFSAPYEDDLETWGYGYSGYYGPEIDIECDECDWIKDITRLWIIDEIDDRMFLATVNYLIKIDMITTSVEPDPIAVNLPPSFQKVAVKWFEGDIPTADYFDSIQRLVDADAIRVVDASDVKRPIPVWVKNTAEAWASDSEDIDEDEYLISVNFLIIESMVKVPDTSEPLVSDIPLRVKKVAKSWTDGEFSDFEYIRQLERLIERGIIS